MKCHGSLLLPLLAAGGLSVVTSAAHAYTINTTEVGKRIRWSVDTVRLKVDPEYDTFLDPGQARAALEMGFEAWRGLPRVPDLVIEPGTPESVGHHDGRETNGVYLLRNWPYEAAKLAVTVVTYEMDSGRLLDADIVVNGKANFALLNEPVVPGKASYDLGGVLTHEAGHVLGLGESNSGQDATMWPYAKPDDTDKRTLAQDDEDGAVTSYVGAPPSAAGGCGFNTVNGRLSGHHGLALSLCMLALIGAVRMNRRQKRLVSALAVVALCSLTVGFDVPQLASDATQARVRKLEQLMLSGTRDDMDTLTALETTADIELARRAHYALSLVRARPSAARVQASAPAAKARLSQLLGSAQRLQVGRAKQLGTVEQSGLLFTDYAVQTSSGVLTTLRVAGGSRAGIEQRVMDSEPPPADAQELVIAEQPDGSKHWAYHHQGVVF
ncbi:MAG: hypothetical protein RL701_925, partial [Pseudomonadota bacterium]